MGQLKECEASNRLSAGRNKSHSTFMPAGQTDRTNSSGIELDGACAKKTSFAEDFMLEHSNSSLFIAMIGSVGRHRTAPNEPQKSTQCYGFPS